MYGQHLMPMAVAPQQYAYMASQARPGQEAGVPMGHHLGGHMMPQGHMQMYAGYPAPQVGILAFQHMLPGLGWLSPSITELTCPGAALFAALWSACLSVAAAEC
jgi:hypothetical protein